jgi:hypothetical protein
LLDCCRDMLVTTSKHRNGNGKGTMESLCFIAVANGLGHDGGIAMVSVTTFMVWMTVRDLVEV